ncbi:hypothetical protein [Micromonospora musae]|nr:hypothetical protein [Micromonospora musae]
MDDIAVRRTGLTRRFGAARAVDDLDPTVARDTTLARLGLPLR